MGASSDDAGKLAEAAYGLEYLHSTGTLHGNINPVSKAIHTGKFLTKLTFCRGIF